MLSPSVKIDFATRNERQTTETVMRENKAEAPARPSSGDQSEPAAVRTGVPGFEPPHVGAGQSGLKLSPLHQRGLVSSSGASASTNSLFSNGALSVTVVLALVIILIFTSEKKLGLVLILQSLKGFPKPFGV